MGLPPSSDSSTANSRLRSWRMRAMRNRYLARSRPGSVDQSRLKARRATATALLTSSTLARAISAMGSSVAGIDGGEPLAAARRDLLAANEEPVARLDAGRCRAIPARARTPTGLAGRRPAPSLRACPCLRPTSGDLVRGAIARVRRLRGSLPLGHSSSRLHLSRHFCHRH